MTAGPVPLPDIPAPCPDGCGHPLTVHSADLGCWLCDCVYGRQPRRATAVSRSDDGWQAARAEAERRAAELFATFAEQQAVAEAELAARGIHPVSIAHGDPETPEDANLIFEALPALAGECGTIAGSRGGNDYITYLFAGPGAADAAVTFIARALAIAPRWWRITPTAHPAWRVE